MVDCWGVVDGANAAATLRERKVAIMESFILILIGTSQFIMITSEEHRKR